LGGGRTLGAVSFGIVALNRGETISAAWLVTAALCVYFIAFRFYALFIADRVLGVQVPTQFDPSGIVPS
jgi:carbon starvation protein